MGPRAPSLTVHGAGPGVRGGCREYSEQLPQQLINRKETITGIAFNPAAPSTIILTSVGFICAVDLEKVRC